MREADAGPTRTRTPPRRSRAAEKRINFRNRMGMMDLLIMAVRGLYNSLLTVIAQLTILE
jgi:hypothetical protein